MQKNHVSAACFEYASGYGYDDLGRDKLEKVYADGFPYGKCAGSSTDHLRNACTGVGSVSQSPSGGMNWYPWPASHTIHWKK